MDAKIDAIKHLHAVFSAKCITALTSSQIVESQCLFLVTDVAWLSGVI